MASILFLLHCILSKTNLLLKYIYITNTGDLPYTVAVIQWSGLVTWQPK